MPNKILEYRRAGTRDGKTSSAGSCNSATPNC